MVVIWSKEAKLDLKNYIQNSKIYSQAKLDKYMEDLVKYTNLLETSPTLGKDLYIYNNTQIKQLIFRMHKIFYYIQDNKIIIIKISHTSRNLDNVIKIINDYFN